MWDFMRKQLLGINAAATRRAELNARVREFAFRSEVQHFNKVLAALVHDQPLASPGYWRYVRNGPKPRLRGHSK